MKKALSFLVALSLVISVQATTYYSTNGASPNSTSNWHTNRNNTGSTPSNFTSGDIFVIQAAHYITTTANWTVSGTNSKITVENGGTLQGDDKVTVPTFQIDNGGTYIHNVSGNAFPGTNTRTFGSSSTVEIWDWNGSTALPSPTTWGNLTLDVDASYNSNWNQAGDLTDIAGNFTIISTGNSSKEFRLATNQDYTLTIGGDLIISGGQLEAGNSNTDADQVIIINGSYNQSGGTFTRTNDHDEMTIRFNGNNSYFTKTSGTLTNTYMDWQVNSGKKLTLSNDLPVASGRSVTVNGTLSCASRLITGSGDFMLAASGTLITSNTSGLIGTLSLSGTESLTSGASYEFQSATTTPFPSAAGTISATNVTIGANVTTNKDITISGTLTLNSGKLTIPTGNTIRITSGIAIAGSGFSSTKHVVTQVNTSTGARGILRMGNFTGTAVFPIGNGTYYLPVTLTASGTNDFSVSVFQGATKNGTPNGVAFSATSKKSMVDAIWMVSRNSGSSSTNMRLAWSQTLEGTDFQSYADSKIGISSYNGSLWDLAFGTGSQATNSVIRTNLLAFQSFGVGKGDVPLPVKFGDLKISGNNGLVKVDWIGLTEDNLHHYEIERSIDGRQFTSIGQVLALHTSYGIYSWTDMNAANYSTLYYRIKAVDIDGKSLYSNILRIQLGHEVPKWTLYPNPVTGNKVSVSIDDLSKGKYELVISDMSGRTLERKILDHPGGTISQLVELPGTAGKGIYTMRISGDGFTSTKTFVLVR